MFCDSSIIVHISFWTPLLSKIIFKSNISLFSLQRVNLFLSITVENNNNNNNHVQLSQLNRCFIVQLTWDLFSEFHDNYVYISALLRNKSNFGYY